MAAILAALYAFILFWETPRATGTIFFPLRLSSSRFNFLSSGCSLTWCHLPHPCEVNCNLGPCNDLWVSVCVLHFTLPAECHMCLWAFCKQALLCWTFLSNTKERLLGRKEAHSAGSAASLSVLEASCTIFPGCFPVSGSVWRGFHEAYLPHKAPSKLKIKRFGVGVWLKC